MANAGFWRLTALAGSVLMLNGNAQAGGFAVPEISIAGIGASNALVADHTELGALPYNPAAAAFHKANTLGGGLILLNPNLSVTTSTGEHDSQGEDILLAPSLQGSYHVNDTVTLVLTTTAPFGLETEWDDSVPVFDSFNNPAFPLLPFPTLGHPTRSNVELVDINPSAVFRLNNEFAVSLGVDYYYVKKIEFNADVGTHEGDGDAWGWSASALYVKDDWSFGIGFHSQADADVEGTSNVSFPFPAGSSVATAELTIPWRLQAGVRYQATTDWAVEFDITRTGWSSFDTLVINNGSGGVASTNNWDDSNAYRIGFTYRLNPKTRLRFGYTFDQTPQPREFFTARVPDNDRHLLSVGASHDLGDGYELDVGYMLVLFEDYAHTGPAFAVGDEPNGTEAYEGDYSAHVHILGVGLTKRFN